MSTATLPIGRSDARYETSAAVAETEASTTTLSSQVQKNAGQLRTAAVDAAHTAEMKEPGSAVDQLEQGLSHKTDVAASQGAADVASVKAAATGYVEQARNLAGSALAAAQSYMSNGTTTSTTDKSAPAPVAGQLNADGLGATAQAALATGKEYLATAQAAAKPYVDSAVSAAQPHLEKAKTMVTGSTTTGDKPADVPSSSAPLESGSDVVGGPYPATASAQSTKAGEL